MNEFIKLWLPIGAFLISIISLLISLFNVRSASKFEAAKKRTELLSSLLTTISMMRNKREQQLLIKKICDGCPKSNAESICSGYDKNMQLLEEQFKKVEELTNISDPILFEHALAKHVKLHQEIKDYTDGIDAFNKRIESCSSKKNGSTTKST